MTNRKILAETDAAFQAAYTAWGDELRHVFGNRAGDARYRPEGKGAPGTALRAKWEAFDAARRAWCAARYLPEGPRNPSPDL